MATPRPQRAGALLLAAALLLVAVTPAAAAPQPRPGGEAGFAAALFDAVAAWLGRLWPGPAPAQALAPLPARAPLGGQFAIQPQLGGMIEPDGGPAVEPQLGSAIDPNG